MRCTSIAAAIAGSFSVNGVPVSHCRPVCPPSIDAARSLAGTTDRMLQHIQVGRRSASADMAGRIDVFVNVRGSGKHSQSGAVSLGLARALKELRPDLEASLRAALKEKLPARVNKVAAAA